MYSTRQTNRNCCFPSQNNLRGNLPNFLFLGKITGSYQLLCRQSPFY